MDMTTPNPCGATASRQHYGETFLDPVCHEPAGHGGTHVGVHRDGTQTGFHYAAPRGTSATEWAREHGTHYRGTVAADNYEPAPRTVVIVNCYFYSTETVTDGLIIDDARQLRDYTHAVYLIDDGRTVRPYYVAAWHPEGDYVIAHPFPTNYTADGSPQPRVDGLPVNYDSWQLGPRRAYHVKVRETAGSAK